MSNFSTSDLPVVAASLRRIADALDGLTVPAPVHVKLTFQPLLFGPDRETANVETIDILGASLLGHPGAPVPMSEPGVVHHHLDGDIDPVHVEAYCGINATPEEYAELVARENDA
jgi:hypothetical protein